MGQHALLALQQGPLEPHFTRVIEFLEHRLGTIEGVVGLTAVTALAERRAEPAASGGHPKPVVRRRSSCSARSNQWIA